MFKGTVFFTVALSVSVAMTNVGADTLNKSHSNIRYDVNIPPLSAIEAFNRLADQTGTEFLYPYDLAKTRTTQKVVGKYTVMEALRLMLENSGLSCDLSDKGAIKIFLSDSSSTQNGEINKMNKSKSFFAGIAALFVSTALPGGVVAQSSEASSDTGTIEEVVVTATKRGATSLQDIPFSIQALSADDLASVGAVDFNDFYHQIPGLSVFDAAPGNKRFVIRGVGGAGAGTVGVYLDEAVVTGENLRTEGGIQADIKTFDIERVEVLKGPQGTTFGSSSLSGTVRYITNKPDLSETSGRVFAGGRSTKGADIGGQFEGMFNLPIIEDKLAIRVAGFYQDQPGYIDAPNVPGGLEGADSEESFAVRGSLQYKPTDTFTFNFMAMVQETDLDSDGFFNETDLLGNTLGEFEQFNFARVPKFDNIKIYNASAEYEMDFGSLSASWSRFERENNSATREATAVLFGITNPTTTPPGRATIITQAKDRTLDTFEFRFASAWESPVQLLAGVFYSDDDRPNTTTVQETDLQGNLDPNGTIYLDSIEDNKVEELALFGDVSVSFLDKLTATVGARYYDFDIEVVNTSVIRFVAQPGSGVAPALTSKEDGVIWKFNLKYDLNDNDSVFLNIAEGFRSGGTNNPGLCLVCNIPAQFESDSIINYEIGAKTSWLDGRMQANGAVYFIDWSDIQFQSFAVPPAGSGLAGRFRFRDNGGAAEILGVEFDITARPTDNLDLSLTANYSDAELSEDNPPQTIGLKGDKLEYSPEFTLATSANYTWPVGNLQASVGADWIYVSTQTTATSPLDPVYRKLDSYHLVNLRAGVDIDNGWSLNVIANNLFNDNTLRTAYDATARAPLALRTNRPRSIFFSVEKTFGGG